MRHINQYLQETKRNNKSRLMAKTLYILIAHPLLFLAQKIIKRFSLFLFCVLITVTIFFANSYTREILPNLSWSNDKVEEQPKKTITKITIKKGDTLGAILRKQDLPNLDIRELITLAKAEQITSRLKIGQKLFFNYEITLVDNEDSGITEENTILNRMVINVDKIKSIEFVRQEGKFVAHHIVAPLKKLITKYETTIDSSVIASLKNVGMSTNSILRLINTYSHQIDFQRQIRSGDKITVITEKFVTDNGELSHHGNILYASLATKKNTYNIYRYSPNTNTNSQFFSQDGESIKSTLLRTPVDAVRISGNFGYRKKHPVLGYGAMHKGVDFAASTGTPIHAAGSGTVQFVGWKSGYGRFVLIKHNKTLSTAYAHASKFAKNLKKGSRVKQGQVIAYVGKSGRVTGAHLHYEVRINGKQVNPMKFKSTPGIKLVKSKLTKFKKYQKQLVSLSIKLTNNIDLLAKDITNIKLY